MRYRTTDQSLDLAAQAWNRTINTTIPAYIEQYDAKTRTAKVTIPFTDYLDTDGEPENTDWAQIESVPVFFPRYGGWSIHAKLKKGDPVLLLFCQRPIDEWFVSDGKTTVTPGLLATHDEGDAIALAGLFPEKNTVAGKDDEKFYLSHKDGNQLILTPDGAVSVVCDKLEIGTEGASAAVAKGTTTDTNLTTLQIKLDLVCGMFGIPPVGVLPSVGSAKAFTND